MTENNLQTEWSLLQNQFDSYEKYSLIIKLANVALLSAAYFTNNISVFVTFLILTLWLQDAIWKTFQSRIETRLLQLEAGLLSGSNQQAYQFNSQFLKIRPGTVGLISEYCRQAIRPTIAFPHVVLVLLIGVELLF